jgi:hypothetical protein
MQMKTKIVSCHTSDSKSVKQEANGTMILPPSVFPAECHLCQMLFILSVTNKPFMLSVTNKPFKLCHFPECRYAECLYTECRGVVSCDGTKVTCA